MIRRTAFLAAAAAIPLAGAGCSCSTSAAAGADPAVSQMGEAALRQVGGQVLAVALARKK